MSRTPVRFPKKGAVADAEARKYLSSENRRAEPRVRQTRREGAEVLVLRSAGPRTPLGAVGPLRQINHSQEAERPGSTTKAWGDLEKSTIQFGMHKGKTFKWLRENDEGYIVYIVTSHMDQEKSFSHQDRLKANKDDLAKYAMSHPEIREKIKQKIEYNKAKERSLQPGQQGAALIGFGPHSEETLKDLYESKDPEKIRFVKSIMSKESTIIEGSKMETAFKYFLQRDTARARAAKEEKHFVDKHRTKLINRVTNIGPILDELLDKDVILPERYDEIRALPTSQEKIRLIFDCLKAGPASKDVFYTILEEKEKYLIKDIKENH